MVQAGQRQCFSAEAASGRFIFHYMGRQHFDSDLALQVFIARPVHYAHSAFSKALEQAVMSEDLLGIGFAGHTSSSRSEQELRSA
jgi:hypothetical protein